MSNASFTAIISAATRCDSLSVGKYAFVVDGAEAPYSPSIVSAVQLEEEDDGTETIAFDALGVKDDKLDPRAISENNAEGWVRKDHVAYTRRCDANPTSRARN